MPCAAELLTASPIIFCPPAVEEVQVVGRACWTSVASGRAKLQIKLYSRTLKALNYEITPGQEEALGFRCGAGGRRLGSSGSLP